MSRSSDLFATIALPLLACICLQAAGLPNHAMARDQVAPDRPDAGSAEVAAPADPLAEAPADSLVPRGQDAPPLRQTALAREARELQDTFNRRLAELTARFDAAGNQTIAAAIQQEIAALKLDLEAQMLATQLREARRRDPADGGDLIAELEQALAAAQERIPVAGDTAGPGLDPQPAPATAAGQAR